MSELVAVLSLVGALLCTTIVGFIVGMTYGDERAWRHIDELSADKYLERLDR